jgi:hypothetical protein
MCQHWYKDVGVVFLIYMSVSLLTMLTLAVTLFYIHNKYNVDLLMTSQFEKKKHKFLNSSSYGWSAVEASLLTVHLVP